MVCPNNKYDIIITKILYLILYIQKNSVCEHFIIAKPKIEFLSHDLKLKLLSLEHRINVNTWHLPMARKKIKICDKVKKDHTCI
jgi:hypothetical protein